MPPAHHGRDARLDCGDEGRVVHLPHHALVRVGRLPVPIRLLPYEEGALCGPCVELKLSHAPPS